MEDNRVVVIGSGPPAAAAAVFLRQAGVEVLVLEAGTERAARGLTLRIRGLTVAKRRGPLVQRANVQKTADPDAQLFEELSPGGLSNHWSCAVPRFSREDFADAARAGIEATWPIGYEDLEPWYARVEPLLHIAGSSRSTTQLPAGNVRHAWDLSREWSAIEEDAPRQGRSVVAMPYAYGADTSLTWSGTAFNSFVRLIRPEQKKGGLTVRFGAHVQRLEWDAQKRRVAAVVFRDRDTGREERIACRAVVLSAGAFNTPQVLLQSKSADFPDGLGNTHGVLGRYLNDHPIAKIVLSLGSPIGIYPAAYVTRAALDRSQPLYAAAGMQWSGAAIVARGALKGGRLGQSVSTGFSVFGTMAPNRDNFVALDPSKPGPDGAPALTLHIRHPPDAARVLEEARDHIVSLFARAGFEPRVDVWRIEPIGNSNHYAGTCRMHASPEFGMVNAWGRMHVAPNLVVADSSVFTTNPEKNPVLTSMTLAARASDRLASELKSGDL